MKTAVCLYGQPRNFSHCWPRIKGNIVDPNDADVFFHCWYDPEHLHMNKCAPGHEGRHLEPGLESRLVEETGAKAYTIDTQKTFSTKNPGLTEAQKLVNVDMVWPWIDKGNIDEGLDRRIKAQYSMWYSIASSILLKDLYSHQNGFKYDCVLLSRFDIFPQQLLALDRFDLEKIHTPDVQQPRGQVCDWMIFSDDTNMNVVGSLFYQINFYTQRIIWRNGHFKDIDCGLINNESFVRELADIFQIPVETHDIPISF